MENDFNRRAEALIAEGRPDEAQALLEAAIRQMPAGWKPVRDEGERLAIAFWDLTEFLAYVARHQGQSVAFVLGSFSKAWYLLAILAVNRNRIGDALLALDRALELEDHPQIWNERGYVLARQKRHAEALACHVRAESARDWDPGPYRARALRGQGVQLIDLGRLDEAEDALQRSLEWEPDNQNARHELQYIANLRRQREPMG